VSDPIRPRLPAALSAWRRLSQQDRDGALFLVLSAAADHADDANGASPADRDMCVSVAVALSTLYELGAAAEDERAEDQPATTRSA
jgi:hypothetical protein